MNVIVVLRRRAFLPLAFAVAATLTLAWLLWNQWPRPAHPFLMRSPGRPLVIAHRGGSGLAPENTLAAFRRALAQGADLLELDVHPTADGEWVVIHDHDLERTTDGHGLVGETTLDEVKKLDAGYDFTLDGGKTFPYRGQGITVPTLDEVFESFPGTRMIIEVKELQAGLEHDLARLIRKWERADQALFVSEDPGVSKKLRAVMPELARAAHSSEVKWFYVLHQFGLPFLFPATIDTLQVSHWSGPVEVITRELVSDAHRRGLQVQVWTVNEPDEMRRLIELGVDGIMTDYPERLVSVLRDLDL